jgi:predicted aspartyl protease
MGLFEVQVGVGRVGSDDTAPVTALVDTAAAHSVMPESLLKRLGLSPLEYRPYSIADGSEVEFGYGIARFAYEGREFPCLVIFGSEDQFLLGATTLQIFNFTVGPAEEKLVTKPLRARSI